jgi:hypothetical protein
VKTRELWKIGRGGTEILKEEGRNREIWREKRRNMESSMKMGETVNLGNTGEEQRWVGIRARQD